MAQNRKQKPGPRPSLMALYTSSLVAATNLLAALLMAVVFVPSAGGQSPRRDDDTLRQLARLRGDYAPPTAEDRARWALDTTIGPASLAAGVFSSTWWTAFNEPPEWGGTWEGWAKRLGTRQAGVAMSSGVEASLGALWGEDPRYIPSRKSGFWARTRHAFIRSVTAPRPDGSVGLAYARYVGTFGNNFVTNAWRPPSDNRASDAIRRGAVGLFFLRFVSNVFREFGPGGGNGRGSVSRKGSNRKPPLATTPASRPGKPEQRTGDGR